MPREQRRGIRAAECVTAYLRGFEEDSRSGVVFWIDELSIEFGCLFFICRGTCPVECVAAHLRGFEEDSRSKVVFWIVLPSLQVEDKRIAICSNTFVYVRVTFFALCCSAC